MRNMTRGRGIGALVEQVVAKADGVPLYVEELSKAVIETGTDSEIPSSLQASLLSRLDLLGLLL